MARVRVQEIQVFERNIEFRLPFRFGAATLTGGPQANIRVCVEDEHGRWAWGCAAEALSPKWFDKNPGLTDEENVAQLYSSLFGAAQLYLDEPDSLLPFQLFSAVYPKQVSVCEMNGLNPLIAGYGPALIDRAILDGLFRLAGVSFYVGIRQNLIGLSANERIPDLAGFGFDEFLQGLHPQDVLQARHTVGLVDPLFSEEVDREERIPDGLPQSLDEVIDYYGNRYFKLKLGGRLESDLERLGRIAEILNRIPEDYFVTLDGNEQYEDVEGISELWTAIGKNRGLGRLARSTLFIEQPINRKRALEASVTGLDARVPVVIDESDSTLGSFLQARDLGYSGVTSKNCKGLYKSLVNRARCHLWNRRLSGNRFFMSAEDLTIQAGVSLQQDCALVSILGIGHAERNGHHFGKGLAQFPLSEQEKFLRAHAGLYEEIRGLVRLRIEKGTLDIRSLDCPGFAVAVKPEWKSMKTVAAFCRT